jgi:hypothetical protein
MSSEIVDLQTERRRRCKDRQLALWLAFEALWRDLCDYDPKVLRELREGFMRQAPDEPLRDVRTSKNWLLLVPSQ